MLKNLLKNITFNDNEKIAVGVSGGADSMILLSALLETVKDKSLVYVINVNHHLRGEESDRDSKFVGDFCEKNLIWYKILDVDVKKLKSQSKMGLEESARFARYDAIFKEMKVNKISKLFLAHHKNDQVETILMHLFRGSGISGMVGIKQSETIIRPLLSVSKNEILDLAKKNNIPFVTDSSNLENDVSRNFLRNEIMPKIGEVFPGFIENIFEFSNKCKEVDDYFNSLVDENFLNVQNGEVLVLGTVFEKADLIVTYHLKRAFEKIKVFCDIEAKHYSMIKNLYNLQVNSKVSLPHNLVAKKTYNGIKILKESSKEIECGELGFCVGEVSFGNVKIVTEKVELDAVEYGKGSLYVDYYKIPQNAVWRIRKIGDKFSKLGAGTKKLNDYFTDKKIDIEKRDLIPVLASDDDVLVVAGLDISDKVKVDSNSDFVLKITFKFN